MNHKLVELFYGDRIEHESERRVVAALRNELERRQVVARLLVNFTVSRGARQVDLVAVTPQRCMNIELKSPDPSLPLVGRVNGPWGQLRPDGTERPMDRNFYTQARAQTYGLSDVMHELANAGRVPQPASAKFFLHIDTVICVAPRIPVGSEFEQYQYVDVIGFDQLIDRLVQPGRGLPTWSRDHWDELLRHLGLYPEVDDSPEAQRRRADQAEVDDYRRRFLESSSVNLHELIPAAAYDGGQPAIVDAVCLAAIVAQPLQRVLLAGESGLGKTHLARHTAIRLTAAGQLVVWITADDYERGRLSRTLSRAVAPFSTERPLALLQKATENGHGVTVIIDALETSRDGDELLKQLNALLLRVPASVLITTSQEDRPAPGLAWSAHIALDMPIGDDERTRLAELYGTSAGVTESDVFRTRFDIAMAAQVVPNLPAAASTADVLDSYIRLRLPNETVRVGLRCLAHKMAADLSLVMPINDAALTLRRHEALATKPSAIDDVLTSPLVSVHQGRLRFGHERLARFLAAEDLVLSSAHGADLGRMLSQPVHQDLREYAIPLERDRIRRYDAIRQIADEELLADAARGKFGAKTAKDTIADIARLLTEATAATPASTFQPQHNPPTSWFGTWHLQRQWSPTEQALLSAAGKCVHNGMFIEEIGALMDATDEAILAAVAAAREAGVKTSTSLVRASVYQLSFSATDRLPATVVARSAKFSQHCWRGDTAVPNATRIWQSRPTAWGRLLMAALLSHPLRHPEDADNLPDLVRHGWATGGSELQIELLDAAQLRPYLPHQPDPQRMICALDGLESDNVLLYSRYIEVLASYGQVSAIKTVEEIQSEIADVLSDDTDPVHRREAQSIVAAIFDDQDVVGSYTEAIDSLSKPERLKLYAMAVQTPNTSIAYPWAMKRLADGVEHADGIVGRALANGAGAVRDDNIFRQQVVAAHLHAIRGWAKVASTLPPTRIMETDLFAQAWRCIDQLIFNLYRRVNSPSCCEQIWNRLLRELPMPAIAILFEIQQAQIIDHNPHDDTPSAHGLLLDACPDQTRQLLEWGLNRQNQFGHPLWRTHTVDKYIVQTLGTVGAGSTADLLREYVNDTALGSAAVAAVKAIETRTVEP